MNLSDAVSRIYRRDWSYTNTFFVKIDLTGDAFVKNKLKFPDDIDINVVSISMPDLNTEPIDAWTINHNRFVHGAEQEISITVRFIDYDNMHLWRQFAKIYDLSKSSYPKALWLDLSVYKSADSLASSVVSTDLVPNQHIITYKDCTVRSIGNIDFNNESDAQVAQFNVMFIARSYSLTQPTSNATTTSAIKPNLNLQIQPPVVAGLETPQNPIPT